MSKPKEIFAHGNIDESGIMKIVNRKLFNEEIKRLGKAEVEIIIRKKRRTVSNPLRRYYFGVVVKMVRLGLQEMGTKLDLKEADEWVREIILAANTETIHEFLKERFIESINVDEETGEIIKVDKSTKRMTNVEFMEFYMPIYQWAAEFLGVRIPEPNEDFEIPDEFRNEVG